MLDLQAVTKRYGKFTAVSELDLQVPRGGIFGFLGPNGAGKTTTIRMISGVLLPSSGRIRVGEDDLSEDPAETRNLAGDAEHAALVSRLSSRLVVLGPAKPQVRKDPTLVEPAGAR